VAKAAWLEPSFCLKSNFYPPGLNVPVGGFSRARGRGVVVVALGTIWGLGSSRPFERPLFGVPFLRVTPKPPSRAHGPELHHPATGAPGGSFGGHNICYRGGGFKGVRYPPTLIRPLTEEGRPGGPPIHAYLPRFGGGTRGGGDLINTGLHGQNWGSPDRPFYTQSPPQLPPLSPPPLGRGWGRAG
jgi:hypothetical protein